VHPTDSRPPELTWFGPWRAWNRFFFTPADPLPLALVRILTGLLLSWNLVWIGTDLQAFLGSTGWADPDTVKVLQPPGSWSVWFAVPDSLLMAVWALALMVMVCLTLGLASPVAAVLAWVFTVSTQRRAPVILFGFDQIVSTWTLYLAVSGASGQAYSIDRWLTRRFGLRLFPGSDGRPTVSANIALRLIQLHFCLIYASAGLAKLQGTPWWDGSALAMLLGNSEFRLFDLGFLARHPLLLQFGTHATIALELLFPILVWLPGWRPFLLAGALFMHIGIALGMGLIEFSLAMVAGLFAFVPADWIDRLIGRRGGRSETVGVESRRSRRSSEQPSSGARTRR
jgi:hypothetical protein